MENSEIQAAGGVLLRGDADNREVLLVHRHRYDGDWTLPKGKVKPGETIEEAAIRELREETGYDVILGTKIGEVQYLVNGRTKTVHYWHLQAVRVSNEVEDIGEVADIVWLDIDEAVQRLSYDLERELLRKTL